MSYQEELLIRIRSAYEGGGFSSLSADMSKAKAGYNQIANSAGTTGSTIGRDITSGTTIASSGMNKLQANSTSTFGAIKAGASAAKSSLGDIGTVITGVVGGLGLMEVAQSMWTGSTTKQFNAAYLGTKMNTAAASEYISTIQQIVAEVPGDDTFMNNLMTGAVAKQTNLSATELRALGNETADYLVTSQSMGKAALETQMDLKEYMLTGNTTQLERDSILKNQMSTLEGQGTVSARILALNKALTAEGYAGLSQLDIASIKWEEIKGKLQLSATTIGERILPYIESFLDYMLSLDEKTNGMSSILLVIVGTLGLAAIAFSPLIGAASAAANAIMTYQNSASKAAKTSSDASSAISGIGRSGIIAAAGLAAAVAALIVVTYLISQNISATAAWNTVEKQRNDQVAAFSATESYLNQKLAEQQETRAKLNATGQDTTQINTDIAATEAAISSNTNAAADAKERYNRAVRDKSALETLGVNRRNEATSDYTKYAGEVAKTGGQAPDTVMDPDYQAAEIREAEHQNRLSSIRLTAAGTMKRIYEGNDTYAKYWKTNGTEFVEYTKQYNEFITSSEKFTEAMDKGDIGGSIWYGISSAFDQADVGMMEFHASVQSWWTDFSGQAEQGRVDAENAIKKPFQDAYTWIVTSWNGLPAWFGGLGAGIGKQWDDVVNYFNDKGTIGGQIYDGLKKIYCIIVGCSPGIIPALQMLYLYALFVFNAMLSPVMTVKNTIQAFVLYIMLRMALLQNDILTKWNLITAIVGAWINTGIAVVTDGINWAIVLWNQATGTISVWVGTGVSVATNAIQDAINWWNKLKSTIGSGIDTVINIVQSVTGSAGSPYEVDYLYGTGGLYESTSPIISTTSSAASTVTSTTSTSKIVISEGAVKVVVGSIDSTERVKEVENAITVALSDLNDSKGR